MQGFYKSSHFWTKVKKKKKKKKKNFVKVKQIKTAVIILLNSLARFNVKIT